MSATLDANERNTPTGVGKTQVQYVGKMPSWKHPHGRGEDVAQKFLTRRDWETPPRAWGRPKFKAAFERDERNTPTGVGKTPAWGPGRSARGKHPHGRGEDSTRTAGKNIPTETPPRAWGRPQGREILDQTPRNTPTGVGKTPIDDPRRPKG